MLPDLSYVQRGRRLGQQVENYRERLLGEDGMEQPGVGQGHETQRTPRRDVNVGGSWDALFLVGIIPLDEIDRPIIGEDRSNSGTAYAERVGQPNKTLVCTHDATVMVVVAAWAPAQVSPSWPDVSAVRPPGADLAYTDPSKRPNQKPTTLRGARLLRPRPGPRLVRRDQAEDA
ncbi:hypothetical protein Ahu01nite_098720 [Winogradskya humida]|uniref:Uncharacterized protein n=1 Tax=Winogradskya humida TaxID=113566 RepID=A0ABQ4A7E0_9ACTN|nr:hypothetical protein Ahu01nite_098720 [Actinoplanes humidus]